MSLDHNMPSQALNNQPALKKAYLQNTQQEGNMKYAYLTNWIAYLDKSISLIKFHITDSYQFFPKNPPKQNQLRIISTTLHLLQLFHPKVSD